MRAVLAFLAPYALPIIATALVLSACAFGVQTWRISNLQERIGSAEQGIQTCQDANGAYKLAIARLKQLIVERDQERVRLLAAQEDAVREIAQLQTEIDKRADTDAEVIESDTSECSSAAVPDPIRLRLDPRGDQA